MQNPSIHLLFHTRLMLHTHSPLPKINGLMDKHIYCWASSVTLTVSLSGKIARDSAPMYRFS